MPARTSEFSEFVATDTPAPPAGPGQPRASEFSEFVATDTPTPTVVGQGRTSQWSGFVVTDTPSNAPPPPPHAPELTVRLSGETYAVQKRRLQGGVLT